jgi:AbrB family looped-hinge helix DNA binding protein
MVAARAKLDENGRVVIPATMRHALGLSPGDELVVVQEGEELRISTVAHAVAQAQAVVGRYVRPGESLSAELLKDRRREASDE